MPPTVSDAPAEHLSAGSLLRWQLIQSHRRHQFSSISGFLAVCFSSVLVKGSVFSWKRWRRMLCLLSRMTSELLEGVRHPWRKSWAAGPAKVLRAS